MKKVFYATLALGALILASCQKENQVNLPKVESPVFTAHIDNGAPVAQMSTKTVLTKEGDVFKSYWEDGDAIRVLNGTNIKGCDAIYTTTDNGASATFTTESTTFKGDQFMALYPATPAGGAVWKSEHPNYINDLWLTGTQKAVSGSYDPEAHLAYAYTENSELIFKNMVALLKVTIASSKDVASISVTVPNEEYIAGNFTYSSKDGEGCIKEGSTRLSTVSLSGTFTDGKDYYIAILPGKYSAFELLVNGISVRKKASAVSFEGGKIYDLGSVRAPFNWGVVGGLNGWNLSSPELLYDTDGDGIYELKNQNLYGGFKFVRLPDCSWTYELGAWKEPFYFDTEMKGSWYDAWYYNIGNEQKNVLVSYTDKNWDIYLYVPEDSEKVFKFTVVPTGSATPSK